MEICVDKIAKNEWVIFDRSTIPEIDRNWFDLDYWVREDRVFGANTGRGSAWSVRSEYSDWILRHYFRGGIAAKLGDDKYFWTGLETTRAFREFRLLALMRSDGLPVPNPIGARVVKNGIFYRCDLIMERIQHEMTFSEWLNKSKANDLDEWAKVGASVARFHRKNIYHADLNTHNILISKEQVYVIDFDRGSIKSGAGSWRRRNIDRLKRSVEKVTGKSCNGVLEKGWQRFIAAYEAGLGIS